MWLILVEAGVAFFLLVFIVWWTMFQGPQQTHDEAEAREAHEAHEALNAPEKADRPDGQAH
jgi:lysylphosphatidylglycerol synthetase-like protein (DUF2156 family)